MGRFLLLLLLLSGFIAHAQQPHEQTNAGTDFWVTSQHTPHHVISETSPWVCVSADSLLAQIRNPDVYNTQDTATIQIVGLEECDGYVTNHATGWTVAFHVVPGQVAEIKIPADEIICYQVSGIQRKGCHIHTNCEVWAYLISNKFSDAPRTTADDPQPCFRKFSKIQLVPLPVLESEYFLLDWIDVEEYQTGYNTYYLVATEDNTQITIPDHLEMDILPIDSNVNLFAWDSLHEVPSQTYFLNAGEVFVISGIVPSNWNDLFESFPSYSRIQTNCKPIAVYYSAFGGSTGLIGPDPVSIWYFFNSYNPQASGHEFVYEEFMGTWSWRFIPTSCESVAAIQASYELYTWNDNVFSAVEALDDFDSVTVVHYFRVDPSPPAHTSIRYIHILPLGCIFEGRFHQQAPADRTVKESLLPTMGGSASDSSFAFLTIVVPPEGIHSTRVNGTLIPSHLYRTRDICQDRYYAARLSFSNAGIPPLFHITNPYGFSANMEECAFDSTSFIRGGPIIKYFVLSGGGAGCTYEQCRRDTITTCVGDTLRLESGMDCGAHAPLVWAVDGVEYHQDELLLPVETADTLTILMIEEKFCRSDTTYHIVFALAPPHLTLSPDTIICRGASVTAQSDMFGFFHWSDGTTDSSFTPQEEGDYTVRIDNACGSDSATIHIRFYDSLHVDFGNDTLLCELATLLLDATQQHSANYLWQDFSTNATYTVINDGRYWVVVTDGCTGASDTIDIFYLYDLQVDLGNDTTICSNHPYTLDVTTPYSYYLWHDGTTAPTHEVTAPGTYSVHVYNVCTEADASVTIEVEDCEEMVHVPNAFTPNGDGQNDLFLPVFNHPERLENYSLHIYDRWGRLLFSTNNPHQGWNCSECPAGVYVWRMEYRAAGEGSKILTGSVTVVR
ncbi:MAG: gliding motility-associated C-terminal domain-containing protein [Bacteroidales bacterium]|nr:gliding motility-associated C-terminal domain-containing protein [Bacteroidales bacterium]